MQAHELPPPAQMVLLLGGFRISQALYAAAALGIADQLVAGPVPAEVLAERAGAHAPSLYRLLRTLASVGVFTEPEPGVFALTPLGQTLTSGQPGSMRDVVIMFMETYAPFADLLHTIRTGQPAAEHLRPAVLHLAVAPPRAGQQVHRRDGEPDRRVQDSRDRVPAARWHRHDRGRRRRRRHVLAAILAAHPHLRGVLFDLPHVITAAPQTLARQGVEDRAECVGGDFFESVPADGDAYLVSLVLHDWPDRQARRILANIAAAGRGARLLVLDFVVPPGDAPHMSKISDLNMLAMMGGKERTGPEWRELLEGTGFTGIEIRQTGTPFSVIQATAQ